MKLQPTLLTLIELLNGRLFRVPEYQRAYSWEKKQRLDLFDDIKRMKTTGDDHFMATIVGLMGERRSIASDSFTEVSLVDGQQRITTLVILLKAIEKALDAREKSKAELLSLLVKGDELVF